MPIRPQTYHRPQDLAQAIQLLAQPDAAPLGGGTRLLAGDVSATTIVDLQDLNLNQIDLQKYTLNIGATATLTRIESSTEISGAATSLLQQAIHMAGPNTFRNAATLGGIIASRESTSTLTALLLLFDTHLVMVGEKAPPDMSLADYLAPDDRPPGLITEIKIRWDEGQGAIAHVGRTPADLPIVSVVGWQPPDGEIRFAATGIAARPCLVDSIDDAFDHPGDFLGSAEYRREMAAILKERVRDQLK